MFGRKNSVEQEADAQPEQPDLAEELIEEEAHETRPTGKGTPTPKRKDQEAARKQPLVPNDRKVAKQKQRQHVAEERARVRVALETGDEQNMPVRDRGPQKRYAREYVDARSGIGEWLMIVVVIFLVLSFVQVPAVVLGTTIGMLLLVAAVILEGFWVNFQLKKRLESKFGEAEKGVRWYGTMRAMQLRRLRLPKPQNRRGDFPR